MFCKKCGREIQQRIFRRVTMPPPNRGFYWICGGTKVEIEICKKIFKLRNERRGGLARLAKFEEKKAVEGKKKRDYVTDREEEIHRLGGTV